MESDQKKRADGRKVRYAVVGAGWIAQEDFMPGVAKTGNSVMTALVTGDAKKGRELSEKYEIEHVCGYDGFDALLKSGKIDAIYLATPNTMHRDFTIRALDRRHSCAVRETDGADDRGLPRHDRSGTEIGGEVDDRLPIAF